MFVLAESLDLQRFLDVLETQMGSTVRRKIETRLTTGGGQIGRLHKWECVSAMVARVEITHQEVVRFVGTILASEGICYHCGADIEVWGGCNVGDLAQWVHTATQVTGCEDGEMVAMLDWEWVTRDVKERGAPRKGSK